MWFIVPVATGLAMVIVGVAWMVVNVFKSKAAKTTIRNHHARGLVEWGVIIALTTFVLSLAQYYLP